jgi:predicted dehydrogenase
LADVLHPSSQPARKPRDGVKPVGIALVGLGWWGKKMLSVLEAVPAEIAVVRAVEPALEEVRKLCADKRIALSAEYADALNDPAVEAVVLATPHALHEAQIEAAVAARKHVFCEKPLALTKAGAEKAAKLCGDAGLVLGMGHERRWEPPIADMLAKADAGQLGRIHQIEANFSHDKFLALDRDNWRLKADHAPAGGMTATGIHLLDLSVRLLGQAEKVLCICESLSSDLPQGDTVAAYVKFRGGGTSYVSASLANPFVSRFAAFGSKGWIDIRDKAHVETPAGWVVTSAMAGGPIETSEVGKAEPVRDNLVSVARAVRGSEPYPITAEHLVNNIALLEAIVASAKSGRLETVA